MLDHACRVVLRKYPHCREGLSTAWRPGDKKAFGMCADVEGFRWAQALPVSFCFAEDFYDLVFPTEKARLVDVSVEVGISHDPGKLVEQGHVITQRNRDLT